MTNKNFGETNSYCPNGFIDQDLRRNGGRLEIVKDDCVLIPLSKSCSNNYSRDAKVVRDMFRDHFHYPKGSTLAVRHGISDDDLIAHWNTLQEMVSLQNIEQGTLIHVSIYKANHCFTMAKMLEKTL